MLILITFLLSLFFFVFFKSGIVEGGAQECVFSWNSYLTSPPESLFMRGS